MDQLTIVRIHDPLNRRDREMFSHPFSFGTPLSEIKKQVVYEEIDVIIVKNGGIVPNDQLEFVYPKNGDFIAIIPRIEGAGIMAVFQIIASVMAEYIGTQAAAMYTASMFATAGESLMFATAAGAASMFAGTAGLIAAGVTTSLTLIGGLLINAILPSASSNLLTNDAQDYSRSNYYSWDPVTTQAQGSIIPRWYGCVPLTGNIISAYTEPINDVVYANGLIHLGYGPYKQLYDFKINGQDMSAYSGVTIETRLGRLTQTIMSNFDDTKIEFNINRLAEYGSAVEYTTEGDTFDDLEVDIYFPKGLFYLNDRGNPEAHGVNFSIEAFHVDTNVSIKLTQRLIGAASMTDPVWHWQRGFWQSPGYMSDNIYWVTVEEGNTTRSSQAHQEGAQILTAVDDGYGNIAYTCSIWAWRYDTYTYFPDIPFDTYISPTITVSRNQTEPFTLTYKSTVPTAGKYKIVVTKQSGEYTDLRHGDQVVFSRVREVYKDDYTYPRSVLVGLRALGTNQLSGSLAFQCMAETLLIRVYRADEVLGTDGKNYRCIVDHKASADDRPITGANWTTYWSQTGRSAVLNDTAWALGTDYTATKSWRTEYNNNYAWVCADMLTQPVIADDNTIVRYEAYNISRLTLADFEEWADFCDVLVDDGKGGEEFRFSFNGGFDSEGSLWANVLKVAQEARAVVYWKGYHISVVVDKSRSSVYMFSSGDIITDTFKETFLPIEDRAAEIDVSYRDAEQNYERTSFFHFNTALSLPNNKVSAQLLGCTSSGQAWRYCEYALKGNQYWLRVISFDVEIDAITVSLGERFEFQHDVPQWGLCGGRVVSATANTVTLDQSVTLEEGTTYGIMIRLLVDDTVVTKTIASPAGTYTTLTISGTFTTTPSEYDVFAFGVLGTETKPFFVTDLVRSGDNTITVTAMEYNENVYSLDAGTPDVPEITYTARPTLDNVSSLTVGAVSYIDQSGGYRAEIFVAFKKPTSILYEKARIFYRRNVEVSGSFNFAGECTTEYFAITNLDFNTTYEILVQSMGFGGTTRSLSESPTAIIATVDLTNVVTVAEIKITGLQLFGQGNADEFDGRDAKFVWNKVSFVADKGLGADEEAFGATTHVPPNSLKGYDVRIYTTSGLKIRSEIVKEAEFIYSYEKNLEDTTKYGLSIQTEFLLRVRAVDIFGNVSPFSVLQVSNSVPADITGLVAKPVVGGVRFEWTENTEADARFYSYRTNVASSGWSSWVDIENSYITRNLTASEIASYTNKAAIAIEVVAKDWYGQTSATAATTSASANTVSDSLFRLVATTTGAGDETELYNGNILSGGVTI